MHAINKGMHLNAAYLPWKQFFLRARNVLILHKRGLGEEYTGCLDGQITISTMHDINFFKNN